MKVAWIKDFYVVVVIFFPLQAKLEIVASTLQYNNETTVIWGGVIPYKIIYIKLFNFYFYFVVILLSLLQVDALLLTAVSACIRPFDANNSTQSPQKGISILQPKVHNI